MHTPHVSVIVPFLNAEKFISGTIESVLAQTYRSWELILVDDGSTDESRQIAEAFSEKHPEQITILAHPGCANRGTSASRNLGLHRSRGRYIAFLDADDVWMPNMLARHVEILERHSQAAMSYGPGKWWYSWRQGDTDRPGDRMQNLFTGMDMVVDGPVLAELYLNNQAAVPSPSGVLFRRDVLSHVGGWDETFTGMYDDQVLYVKVALGRRVYVSSDCLYLYRQHEDSICAKIVRDGRYYPAREKFLDWIVRYLHGSNGRCKHIRALADRELWFVRMSAAVSDNNGVRRSVPRKIYRASIVLGRLAVRKGPLFLFHPTTGWAVREVASRILPRFIKRPIHWSIALFRRQVWYRIVRLSLPHRVRPVSRVFGFDRGLCIDRYYIETFLAEYSDDIRGNVLEIANNTYTQRFGAEKVTKSDVLHAAQGNPNATIVADLTRASNIASDEFDCIIFTQTLQFVYDTRAVVRTLHRILKPQGVLLATFAGISQISRYDMDRWGDYWRFTTLSARRLFGDVFGPQAVEIESYGNVLAASALLYGLSADELRGKDLDYNDPDYELVITVRAVK